VKGNTILITGGSGYLGQGLVKYLIKTGVKHIRIFSRSEHKQLDMSKNFTDERIDYLIGDVRDYKRLRLAMMGVDIVIHCAALKCIEKGQSDPIEFIKTNVVGANNIVDCALELKTPKIIGISTDKACGDVINLYGATKLNADMLFQAANNYNKNGKPEFIVVRYGNVIGSTGSVIPLWKKQKAEGKPITITDPNMTRFIITLNEAVELIFHAIEKGKAGEIIIPELYACTIAHLAANFAPCYEQKIIGLRPGERMYEVLSDGKKTYRSDSCPRFTNQELRSMLNGI